LQQSTHPQHLVSLAGAIIRHTEHLDSNLVQTGGKTWIADLKTHANLPSIRTSQLPAVNVGVASTSERVLVILFDAAAEVPAVEAHKSGFLRIKLLDTLDIMRAHFESHFFATGIRPLLQQNIQPGPERCYDANHITGGSGGFRLNQAL
jgi:hypothetical protein